MLKGFNKCYVFRSFSRTGIKANLEKPKPSAPAAPAEPAGPAEPPTSNSTGAVKMNFAPSEFDKKILVWAGRYKSVNEVPSRISYDTMDNARSRVRIKMSNIMILATLCLCGFYVWRGKKSLQEGDTIRKRVLERDQKFLEEYRKSKAE